MSTVRFDLSKRAVVGEPVRVLDDVASTPTSSLNVVVTRTGTMVFLPRRNDVMAPRTLVWVDRQGHESPIAAPPRAYESVRLSPDNTKVAVGIRDEENDIWVWNLEAQRLERQTYDPDIDIAPVWTPDSGRLLFSSARSGVYSLYVHDVNGNGGDIRLTSGANTLLPDSVTPDGTSVVAHEVRPNSGSDLLRVRLDRTPEAAASAEDLVQTQADEWNGELSPDGRLLAYQSTESGRSEVLVRPYPQVSSRRWQVSSGGAQPVWTRGGRELIYIDGEHRLTAVPIDISDSEVRIGRPTALATTTSQLESPWREYDVTPDGQRFLVIKQDHVAGDTPQQSFVVVVNWFEELKRLVSR
jgi:Tol biopolymer transport system component